MKHKQAQKLKYNANKLCVKLACIMIMDGEGQDERYVDT